MTEEQFDMLMMMLGLIALSVCASNVGEFPALAGTLLWSILTTLRLLKGK